MVSGRLDVDVKKELRNSMGYPWDDYTSVTCPRVSHGTILRQQGLSLGLPETFYAS